MKMASISRKASLNTRSVLVGYAVIITLLANILKVDAIRCHQCNSHLEEECSSLRLATPRAPRDVQYLKDCDESFGADAFCRKVVTKIEVTGELRVVRGCGWLRSDMNKVNMSCVDADNEGFKQEICTCFADGCNAAPAIHARDQRIIFVSAVFAVLFSAAALRRNA